MRISHRAAWAELRHGAGSSGTNAGESRMCDFPSLSENLGSRVFRDVSWWLTEMGPVLGLPQNVNRKEGSMTGNG